MFRLTPVENEIFDDFTFMRFQSLTIESGDIKMLSNKWRAGRMIFGTI
jgi:hypothetical protein